MTIYELPEGMTAERLRELAEDMRQVGGWSTDAATVDAWADAIDPPAPPSIVTDEMVEAYAAQRTPDKTLWGPQRPSYRSDLEAVERLGWLRDPEEHKQMLRWIEEAVLALDAASRIGARSCNPGDGLDLGNHARLIQEAADWTPMLALDSDATDRLKMAERLLRRATGGVFDAIWCVGGEDEYGNVDINIDITPDEAEYLRSLNGEGEN